MILETPSIYNVPGVCNQGAGGGDWFNYGELELGGKKYKTLKTGSLIWLCENLVFLPNEIQLGLDGTPATPAAWFYNNDISNSDRGLLYNWYSLSIINNYLSFCATPCGSRYNTNFYSLNTEINIWASDQYDFTQAYYFKIGVSDNSLFQENYFYKHLGYSVRLCKDA